MRVLVIGGCGFIGSHIVDALLTHGVSVTVYDRHGERFRDPLPSVQYVKGELADRELVAEAIGDELDAVVHSASATVPQTSNDNPSSDVEENLVTTLGLLDLCAQRKVHKIVFLSSGGTVYGVPRSLPISEDHPTHPICSYGIVKLAIEEYCNLYARRHGLRCTILRLSNPYGIRQSSKGSQGVIPIFLHRMLASERLVIWGDGTAIRDFVHVKDVARLCCLALRSDVVGTFNAGSGVGTRIRDLVDLMAGQLGVVPDIVHEAIRDFDIPSCILDCRKARQAFSWSASIPLSEGVQELASWMMEAGDGYPQRVKASR